MSLTKVDRLKHELDGAIGSGDFELAFQAVNDMLDLDPENVQYWNSKGIIMSKMDRIEDAIASFDRGLEIAPNDPKLWYSKGCVLMDSGEHRLALACIYKSLDLDPAFEKARERFNRCLDSWIASGGRSLDDDGVEGGNLDPGTADVEGSVDIDGIGDVPSDDDGEWAEEEILAVKEEEGEDEEAARLAEELKRKKKTAGSFLDDDLFSDEDEDRKGGSRVIPEPDEGSEEDEEPWDDEGSDDDDDGMPEVKKTIKCKCGSDIPIYSDDRPYRFKCFSCERSGTLKA